MNSGDSLLATLLVCLMASVLAVPGAQKLGLGRVLGYLVAGIFIGPWGLALIREPAELRLLAEVATGMLLFLIGIEMQPRLLQRLQRHMLKQGLPFWGCTVLLFLMVGISTGLTWPTALAVAAALALSSHTLISEFIVVKNLQGSSRGDNATAITLTHGVLFLPLLILLPLLGFGNPLQDSVGLQSVLMDLFLCALILIPGHLVLKHAFRYITATQSPEMFVAAVLLMLVGSLLLCNSIGSSAFLGAYLAGCLMAASEFRQELVSTLRPWRGLLLGFFFLTLGVSVDFGLLLRYPLIVLAVLLVMLTIKILVSMGVGYLASGGQRPHLLTSMLAAPAGELSFVALSIAMAYQAIDRELGGGLIVVVASSMILTPVLQTLYNRRRNRLLLPDSDDASVAPVTAGTDAVVEPAFAQAVRVPVMIAGFGRMGQVVCRLMVTAGMQPVLIDHDPAQLADAKRIGFDTWCGDALRLDLLEQAGLGRMSALVVALDDRTRSMQLIDLVREKFPQVRLVVRSADRYHQVELACAGVKNSHRENFESAVLLGEDALAAIGIDWEETERISEAFRDHETHLVETEIAAARERSNAGEPPYRPALSRGYTQTAVGLGELLQRDNDSFEREKNQKQG